MNLLIIACISHAAVMLPPEEFLLGRFGEEIPFHCLSGAALNLHLLVVCQVLDEETANVHVPCALAAGGVVLADDCAIHHKPLRPQKVSSPKDLEKDVTHPCHFTFGRTVGVDLLACRCAVHTPSAKRQGSTSVTFMSPQAANEASIHHSRMPVDPANKINGRARVPHKHLTTLTNFLQSSSSGSFVLPLRKDIAMRMSGQACWLRRSSCMTMWTKVSNFSLSNSFGFGFTLNR